MGSVALLSSVVTPTLSEDLIRKLGTDSTFPLMVNLLEQGIMVGKETLSSSSLLLALSVFSPEAFL